MLFQSDCRHSAATNLGRGHSFKAISDMFRARNKCPYLKENLANLTWFQAVYLVANL